MATGLKRGPAPRLIARLQGGGTRRLPAWLRMSPVFVAAFAVLFCLQLVAFDATRIPIDLRIRGEDITLHIDGHDLSLQVQTAPTQVTFAPGSPLLREYQIDGTDNTNNFTEDAGNVAKMSDQPYFQFQNWMRDARSYSSWRDVAGRRDDVRGAQLVPAAFSRGMPASVTLPAGQRIEVSATLMRLEAPAQVVIFCGTNPCGVFTVNRNDRYVRADFVGADGSFATESQIFFPTQPLPFFAENVYLLAHVALWSLVLLGTLVLLHVLAVVVVENVGSRRWSLAYCSASAGSGILGKPWSSPFQGRGWNQVAMATVVLSFGFTCYVALVQYHAEPHILDASAYVMQAKIFASGWLSAPTPGNLPAFQGPFMVAHDGRWFAQYPPGTSLLLAVGYLARLPWLIEPLLGALALWGVYRLGRAWYGYTTAWLAVFMAALSAFYIYLAASYLSHVPALFFEVYCLLYLTRYARNMRRFDLLVAAACWCGLLLTRELTAAIVGLIAPALIFAFQRRDLLAQRGRLLIDSAAAMAVAIGGCCAYLLYDYAQTGAALITPRMLFSPADHLGFGQGIGFYGQHTVAAGLVNLDELLTSLSIDLYGWPFYLTLALIPLAFVGKRAHRRWDMLCLVLACTFAAAQIAYFYHGIYLGPRYLFDALPFLVLLTARGITNLPRLLIDAARHVRPTTSVVLHATIARVAVVACVGVLLLCNLLYYLPRQLALHANFSGLPATQAVDVGAIYSMRPAQAVVLTDSWSVYNNVLWPLNDPSLRGQTLYAYAPSLDIVGVLRSEYPNRRFYNLVVAVDGSVHLEPLAP